MEGARAVSMTAIGLNPLDMSVQASFTDADSGQRCYLNKQLFQQGKELLVWGTGCRLNVDPDGKTPLERNNYYSLTHLQASGSIVIGGETIAVTGMTWMDHQYGAFPDDEVWVLQDIQLGNGVSLSNFANDTTPQENVPMSSNATIL